VHKNVQQVADIKILQRAKIIACTTSRAARDIEILKRVSPKIILLEEAAEIPGLLESCSRSLSSKFECDIKLILLCTPMMFS
jgi:hypothetical protein